MWGGGGGLQVKRHHLDHMSPCGDFRNSVIDLIHDYAFDIVGKNEILYVQRVLVSLILEWLVIVMFRINAAQSRFYLVDPMVVKQYANNLNKKQ